MENVRNDAVQVAEQPLMNDATEREQTRVATSVSLVLPMFNESESVDYTLQQALENLEQNFLDFEIIVADDGSTDNCAAKVQSWCERDPRIVLIRIPHNQRFGVALRNGLAAASKDVVIYTDFDLPVALDFLPKVLDALVFTDIVTGYSAEQAKNLSWGSRLLSRGYNRLVHTLFRLPLRDVNFGFKAMHKSVCEQLELGSRSPFVDAEMFIQARRSGYSITEIAVPFVRRKLGVSRIRRFNVVAWSLLDMVTWGVVAALLSQRYTRTMRKISSGSLVSALLTIVQIAGGSFSLNLTGPATALTLLVPVLAISRLIGLASGLVASAFATATLAILLPPSWSMDIARPVDRLILALFIVSAAVGSRLATATKE